MAQRCFELTLFIVGLAASFCSAGPTQYGAVTITKMASEAGSTEFSFTSPQLGDFTLTNGQSITFDELVPGNYAITEQTTPGWQLYLVVADSSTSAATDMLDWATYTFRLSLDAGEALDLTFHNRATGETPLEPPPSVPVPSAMFLTTIGAGVVAGLKRRRRL